MISQKVPFLLSVPEQLIHESFVTRPSKIKRAEAYLRSLLHWERYEPGFIRFLEKMLRRIRVLILKSDSFVSGLLAGLQKKEEAEATRSPQYWAELRVVKANAPDSVSEVSSAQPLVSVPAITPASPLIRPEAAPSKLDGIRKVLLATALKSVPPGNEAPSRLKMLSLALRAERKRERTPGKNTIKPVPVFASADTPIAPFAFSVPRKSVSPRTVEKKAGNREKKMHTSKKVSSEGKSLFRGV